MATAKFVPKVSPLPDSGEAPDQPAEQMAVQPTAEDEDCKGIEGRVEGSHGKK